MLIRKDFLKSCGRKKQRFFEPGWGSNRPLPTTARKIAIARQRQPGER
jgi:hypothetical protein